MRTCSCFQIDVFIDVHRFFLVFSNFFVFGKFDHFLIVVCRVAASAALAANAAATVATAAETATVAVAVPVASI